MTSQFKNTEIIDTGFLRLPRGTTNERPASPEAGQIRFNTDLGKPEWYDDSVGQWLTSDISPYVHAEGGDRVYEIQENNITYRVHEFTSVGESKFTVTRGGEVEYLVVAGGGGGGTEHSGGGGAGGLITGVLSLKAGTENVNIGNGGSGNNGDNGDSGQNSSLGSIKTIGGGGGKRSGNGSPGGSGGAGAYNGTGGAGVAGQGNPGGSGINALPYPGGGGGGAGSAGGNATSNQGGRGGQGIFLSITGNLTGYAGGGGGGVGSNRSESGFGGIGGSGGGGNGGDMQANNIGSAGENAVSNTGGGGGGGSNDSSGGNGGSGIVVVRYPILNTLNTSTLDLYPGAAAAYSLRRISSNSGSVIRGRRSLDNQERDFSAFEIENGKAEQFAKAQNRLPASYGDGAAAAYSLRYVRGGYAGPVVRVRRSSDNTEQDFTPTEIEDGSLESFCGSGDGLVTTWYDQSGNGNDATQTTASDQPKIVDAGTLVTENGRPALDFDGVDDHLIPSSNIDGTVWDNDFTLIAQVNYKSFSSFNYIFSAWGTRDISFATFEQSDTRMILYDGDGNSVRSNTLSIDQNYLFTHVRSKNDGLFFYENGSLTETDPFTGNADSRNETYAIGARYANNRNDANYYLKELILYPSDQSSNREAIEENINRYYGIYAENTADLFVTTWYDQSGNGNDATQTTASEQPKIVTGGVLVTENGKAALEFDGVDDYLQAPILTSYWNNAHASIIVFNYISGAAFIAGGYNSSNSDRERYRPDTYNRMSTNTSISVSGQSLVSYLYNGISNGGLMEPFVNSVLQNTANQTTEFTDLQLFDFGASVDFDNYTNCIIQEVILYPSDQSSNRELIETNINNHYGIY